MAEMLLRVFKPVEFRVRGNAINLNSLKNMKTIIENTKLKKLDKVITVTTNSVGLRGEDPPYPFEAYLTIIAVGGSTTECGYLSNGKDWPLALGEKLKKSFRRVWMNNAGLNGHSTFGHMYLVRDYISFIHPKIILFMVGINDSHGLDIYNNYDKGIIDIVNEARRNQFLGKPPFSVKTFLVKLKTGGFSNYAAEYSDLVSFLLTINRSYRARKGGLGHIEVDFIKLPHLEVDEQARQALLDEHREKYVKLYKTRLEALLDLTQSFGIEPVLITSTALWGYGRDDITGQDIGTWQYDTIYNYGLLWDKLELYNDITRQVGAEKGLCVIDLAHEMPKSSAYYYDAIHFTNLGADKCAEIISQLLTPYLQKKYPGYAK